MVQVNHIQGARSMSRCGQFQFPVPLIDLGCCPWPLAFAGLLDQWAFVETIKKRRVAGSGDLAPLCLPLQQKKDRLLRLLFERLVVFGDEGVDECFCALIEPGAPVASTFDLGQQPDEAIAVDSQCFRPLRSPSSARR